MTKSASKSFSTRDNWCVIVFRGKNLLGGLFGGRRSEILERFGIRFHKKHCCFEWDGQKISHSLFRALPKHKVAESHIFASECENDSLDLFFCFLPIPQYYREIEKARAQWKKNNLDLKRISAAALRPFRKIPFLPEHIRKKIHPNKSGCWIWGALPSRNSSQYGSIRYEKRSWPAHRLIYKLLGGEIPEGTVLRHSCDNRACVNPQHLEPGSKHQNTQDMLIRGRAGRRSI